MSPVNNARFYDVINTPLLWKGDSVFELNQFELPSISYNPPTTSFNHLRMGMLVEQFVFHAIKQIKEVQLIANNIQIIDDKITIGEIDALLVKDNVQIHTELIYKFYLYDETVGFSELEHWIGPNRKDSLIEKLTKLKNHQLPLLTHKRSVDFLQSVSFDIEQIEQFVHFQAQLFIPFSKKNSFETSLNNECIYGVYYTEKQTDMFVDCKFYLPSKLDWLVTPNTHVNWLGFKEFKQRLLEHFEKQKSPLVWIKHPKGIIEKCFVVWW